MHKSPIAISTFSRMKKKAIWVARVVSEAGILHRSKMLSITVVGIYPLHVLINVHNKARERMDKRLSTVIGLNNSVI